MTKAIGKLSGTDQTVARILKVAPWLTLAFATLPVPIVFLIFFFAATATESAALYLLLAGASLGIGFLVGLVLAILLVFYRRHWLAGLRDRLAADGITASEVAWFRSELTSTERQTLDQMQ